MINNISQSKQDTPIPHHHDVLAGRGNNVNSSPGNKFFRELVKAVRVNYVATPKQQKPLFSQHIFFTIQSLNPPGRFLKKCSDNLYHDVGDKKAIEKTRQALREGAPEVERQLEEGSVKPKNISVQALVEEEAARLYEEQFGTSMSDARVTGIVPDQHQDLQNQVKEIIEPIPFANEQPFQASCPHLRTGITSSGIPPTPRPGLKKDDTSTRSLPARLASDNQFDSEDFLPKHSGNEDTYAVPGMMSRRPALFPMHSDTTLAANNISESMMFSNNDLDYDGHNSRAQDPSTYDDDGNLRTPIYNETMDWQQRNNDYLADLDQRCKKSRRRSSAVISNFRNLMVSLGEDAAIDDDDEDEEFIEARLNQISNMYGNQNIGNVPSQTETYNGGSMDGITSSIRTSLTLNEIFDDSPEKCRASLNRSSMRCSFNRSSMRGSVMSLSSRRSTRVSLALRQSFVDSMASLSDGEDSPTEKYRIPDVFGSKLSRRDSVITPSTRKLVSTVFGVESAKIAASTPGTENALLRGALEPLKADELMAEVLGESLDSFAEVMHSCERDIDKLVDATVWNERQRVQNQVRLDDIRNAGVTGEYKSDDVDNSSLLNSSMDLSVNMNASLEKLICNETNGSSGI
jgi:hypothetical protein